MAKRYYNLEKETKEYLKACEARGFSLPRNVTAVNDNVIKRKAVGKDCTFLSQYPVVLDGLFIWLDASVSGSVSSTTWFNLIEGKGNATLFNGPTFMQDLRGSINFNGINQRAEYSAPFSNAISVITICRSNLSTWSDFGGLGSNRSANGFILHSNGGGTTTVTYYILRDASNAFTNLGGFGSLDVSKPRFYGLTTNGSDVHRRYGNDTVTTVTTSITRSISDVQGTCSLAAELGARFHDMKYYTHMYYNRELTTTEMLQNYNVYKSLLNL